MTASFLLPAFLLVIVYIHLGIAPFGSKSMVYSDARGQYISFFALYQDLFSGKADWYYSFSKLLGGPIAGLFAYYLASPLTLLLLLFPRMELVLGMDLLHFLKLSLCGLTMAVYISETRGLKPQSLVFTTAYTWCGYNIAYGWCIMWIDAVVLLPLIALGIRKLWGHGKPGLYIASLSMGILSCFYTGYMLCLFSVLFFGYLAGSETEHLKELRPAPFVRFAAASVLAGGLTAVLLLPGILALKNGVPVSASDAVSRFTYRYAIQILKLLCPEAENPNALAGIVLRCALVVFMLSVCWLIYSLFSEKYGKRTRVLSLLFGIGLFVAAYFFVERPVHQQLGYSDRSILLKNLVGFVTFDEFYDGSPNVYVGTAAFLLAILWMFNNKIPRRRRAAGFLLLGILLASVSFNLPNVIWHGFEKNNCFNYRYSFVICFSLLSLAEENLRFPEGISLGAAALTSLFCIGILLFCRREPIWGLDAQMMGAAAIFLAGSISALFLWHYRAKAGQIALALVELAAVLITADISLREHTETHSESRQHFQSVVAREQQRIARVSAPDSEFGRIRRNGAAYNYNDPMLFCFPGLVHFSSSEKLDTILFLGRLGQKTLIPYWSDGDSGESRALDALLDVRYYLGDESIAGYAPIEDGILQNPYALPLAFFSASDRAGADLALTGDAAQNLNRVYAALCGKPVEIFSRIHSKGGTFTVSGTDPVYVTNRSGIVDALELRRNGEKVLEKSNLCDLPMVCLGSYPSGAVLNVLLFDRNGKLISDDQNTLYYEHTDVLNAVTAELGSSTPAEIRIPRASKIDLHLTAEQQGRVILSLPYDEGWKLKIDGKPAECSSALGILLSAAIPEGEHDVSLHYVPPGLPAGSVISLVSLMICAGWLVFLRPRRK